MAFVFLSRFSKPQGSGKAVHQKKSARPQYSSSQFGFATPGFRPSTSALPTALAIQTKLKVGAPHDHFEQQADRIADLVMRMPDSAGGGASKQIQSLGPVQRVGDSSSSVQRQCRECEEKLQRQPIDQDATLQTSRDTGVTPQATPKLGSQIKALKRGGQPLPQSIRTFFEPRFGYDFSKVRVHPDAQAVASAVHARAFTVGHDIGFDPGQYATNSQSGKWLLAHELTHVIQQERGLPDDRNNRLVQRKDDGSKVSKYQDCTSTTTLTGTPNPELESARLRAVDFVNGAICKLPIDPTTENKDKSYPVAIARHFMSPGAAERKSLKATYGKILDQLQAKKIRCVATKTDQDYCDTDSDAGMMAGFNRSGETFLCQSFWTMNHKCRAMTLIHEAAHAVGIGMGTPHPPYRGSDQYPFGTGAPGAGQSTALRMDNPDAYSYFAAHVWRDIDTECHVLVGIPEVIEINDTKPTPATKP